MHFLKRSILNVKVSRSKFCELHPKECITVGSSGSHSVCVCTYHQNAKLMHSALNISEMIHDLTDLIGRDKKKESACCIGAKIVLTLNLC